MRALEKVHSLTPGSFPVYPFLTLSTTCGFQMRMGWETYFLLEVAYQARHPGPPLLLLQHIQLAGHLPDVQCVVLPRLTHYVSPFPEVNKQITVYKV